MTGTFDPQRHADTSGNSGPSLSAPAAGTAHDLARYLTDGFWNDQNGSGRRSWDTTDDNRITVNINGLTPEGKKLAQWAMDAWEMVADIQFVTVTGTADITFDDNQPGAYASSATVNDTVTRAEVNIDRDWIARFGSSIDSYTFSTYIHELGHALGLGHQGDYNGDAIYSSDATFSNDSWQMSVMSYFSQTDNTTVNASYANVITAMMADIIAIQSLYGAPGASGATAGNTIWGANTNLSGYLGNFFDSIAAGTYSGGPIAFTIYDQGGIDTVDLSFTTRTNRIDMNDGTFSDVNGLTGNVGIAVGTVIENLTSGSGHDRIIGNQANNRIDGGDGNDRLFGEGGNDVLFGGNGNDTLQGGDGNDTLHGKGDDDAMFGNMGDDVMYGGNGFDLMYGQNGHDTIVGGNGRDTLYGGNGNDVLQDNGQRGDLGRDLFFGEQGNDTIYAGGGNDTLHGNDGNDLMFGGLDDDLMFGGNQFDEMHGQHGNDTMLGGNGRDTLYGGNGDDVLQDNGQQGDLGRDLFFGGAGNDTIYAGGGNDTLHGEDGDDLMFGGLDDDLMFGGNGFDEMHGQLGNDTMVGGNGRDTLYGGNGDDLLIDNEQQGDFAHDQFFGGNGNDTIQMEGGNDTATGGADADTFVFVGDKIGADVITDFQIGLDQLHLDDALWDNASLTPAQILDFADDSSGTVVFDFGNGNTITLEGIVSTDALGGSIEFF